MLSVLIRAPRPDTTGVVLDGTVKDRMAPDVSTAVDTTIARSLYKLCFGGMD